MGTVSRTLRMCLKLSLELYLLIFVYASVPEPSQAILVFVNEVVASSCALLDLFETFDDHSQAREQDVKPFSPDVVDAMTQMQINAPLNACCHLQGKYEMSHSSSI